MEIYTHMNQVVEAGGHLQHEHIKEYKKEYNNPHLSSSDVETKKRIALRNVVRNFGLKPK